jgi:hypothetical protein
VIKQNNNNKNNNQKQTKNPKKSMGRDEQINKKQTNKNSRFRIN